MENGSEKINNPIKIGKGLSSQVEQVGEGILRLKYKVEKLDHQSKEKKNFKKK